MKKQHRREYNAEVDPKEVLVTVDADRGWCRALVNTVVKLRRR